MAILTLGLGIGATTAVFGVVDALVLRPLPCPDPDRLAVIMERHPQRGLMALRPALYAAWRQSTRTVDQAAPFLSTHVVLREEERHVQAMLAGAGYLETWGVAPRLGRSFVSSDYQAANAPEFIGHRGNAVILSDGLWRRVFGANPLVVGHAIEIDNRKYVVAGIMPPSFRAIDPSELWVPWIMTAAEQDERRFHYFMVVARMRHGVSLPDVRREMADVYRLESVRNPENNDWLPEPFRPKQLPLSRRVQPNVLALLSGAVLLVLLISCVNVSNLMLARNLRQRREIALRLALGSTRVRLARQLLSEGLLLALAGSLLAAAVTFAVLRLTATVPVIANAVFAFQPGVNLRVVLFMAVVLISSLVAFSAIPALTAAVDPMDQLRTSSTSPGSGAGRLARAVLVSVEVAVAVVVVVVTTLTVRSFGRLLTVDPGVQTTDVLTARLERPPDRLEPNQSQPGSQTDHPVARFYEQVLQRVRALPDVRQAAVGSYVPMTDPGRTYRFAIEGRTTSARDENYAVPNEVSRDFFRTLGIRLLEGREFDSSDRALSDPVAIVSASAARAYWPGASAIGQRVRIAGSERWSRIVGIVSDVYQTTLEEAPQPALYLLHEQFPIPDMTVFVRASHGWSALVPAVRQAIRSVDSTQTIDDLRSMDEVRGLALGQPELRTSLLAVFGVLALVLAMVGIYGVVNQMVSDRRRELGVRMALGATKRNIVWHVVAPLALYVAGGLGAGLL
ncbi:MAG TPA: ADOP family duplicated permease, partial [Vicinamibacterales bacterium]|nr:ADOP family duplicated permease [Vicinamibacterales bacterium]